MTRPPGQPAVLAAAIGVLVAGGCATSSTGPRQTTAIPTPAATTTVTTTTTITATPSPTGTNSRQISLACTGTGSGFVHEVAAGNLGTDLAVAWSGKGQIQISKRFSIQAWVTDPDTTKSRVVAWTSFADGKPPEQSIYEPRTRKYRHVPASKQSEPAIYPGALDGMGSRWTVIAMAYVDEKVVAMCSSPITVSSPHPRQPATSPPLPTSRES